MNSNVFFFVVNFLATVLVTYTSAYADDALEIAKEYCSCTEAANKSLEAAVGKVKSGDMKGAEQTLQQMNLLMAETEGCTKKLQEKYSVAELSEEVRAKMQKEILRTCPTPSVEGLEKLENKPLN